MARSLNCEQGPTSTPCGVCDSCVSLAPGGSGNLDVTELDAASHNGVEDMRELRDRAYYAPAESRYRIFIIDEAHMISTSGANALLKVVEEPPEHVIFIFATTEPDKIIGTIRSRTHHYPFRLLTPPAMQGLLERTVASEGVYVEDSVYPLVIAAGGGSPRDTLSVLDQLLAGAGPDGLTYDLARPLLGVTDETLLDDTIAALAAGDKAALFTLIDAVVEAGHEPRRFAKDLLDRLRDLLVLQAVPTALEQGLVSAPAARGEVLREQAAQFSGAHLSHLAATVNAEMANLRGATSPRLLLEILAARLVVGPTAPATGLPAGAPSSAMPAPAAGQAPGQASGLQGQSSVVAGAPDGASAGAALLAARRARAKAQERSSQPQQPAAEPQAASAPPQQQASQSQRPQPEQPQSQQPPQAPERGQAQPAQEQQEQPQQEQAQPAQEQQAQQEPAAEAAPAPAPAQAPVQEPARGDGASEEVDPVARATQHWSRVREEIYGRDKAAGIMLAEARVLGLKDDTLILGHTTGALAKRINDAQHNGVIAEVVGQLVAPGLKVECVVGTDPEAVGLPPLGKPAAAWNPNSPAREHADDKEAESPAPQPAKSEEQPPAQAEAAETGETGDAGAASDDAAQELDVDDPAAAQQPEPRTAEAVEQSPQPEAPSQTQQPERPARQGWGAPAPIGQDLQDEPVAGERTPLEQPAAQQPQSAAPAEPSVAPTVVQPAVQLPSQPESQQEAQRAAQPAAQEPAEPQQEGGWRSRIAQATQAKARQEEEWAAKVPSFSDGVPLPPEPAPEEDFAPPENFGPGQFGAGPQQGQPVAQAPAQGGASAQSAQPTAGTGGAGSGEAGIGAAGSGTPGATEDESVQPAEVHSRVQQAAARAERARAEAERRREEAMARAASAGGAGAAGAAGAAGTGMSQDEEEEMMATEAQKAGEQDHRTSMEVAMELLERELGARRV